MKSRRSLLPIFFLFLFLAVILFFVSGTLFGKQMTGLLEQMISPLQRTIFTTIGTGTRSPASEEKLITENTKLQTQLAKFEDLKKENNALREQFETSKIVPNQLIPAQIIGGKSHEIILDRGIAEGVKAGDILIVRDNVIGKIITVSAHRSVGELVTKSNVSFTAKTSKTSALGIISGKNDRRLVLSNVVLSDKLEKNDLVVTKGDIDKSGKGFPPDLVVGKIISINKKDSELFQSAEVEPLVEFEKLETVFVKVN